MFPAETGELEQLDVAGLKEKGGCITVVIKRLNNKKCLNYDE